MGIRRVNVGIGAAELHWARGRAEREGTSLSAVLTRVLREAREAEARRERQRSVWAAFEHWATGGTGLGPEALEAAEGELLRGSRAPMRGSRQ